MDYSTLQTNVQSAMGRSDIPSYVYTLTTSGLNRDLRLVEMLTSTTLYTSDGTISLPSDFLEMESVYIDSGGVRTWLVPFSEQGQSVRHDSSGRPYYYDVVGDELAIMPTADTDYDVTVRYYAKLDALSASSDTNDVLTNYPGLYLYAALTHAAVWAQDMELSQTYNAAFMAEKKLVEDADKKRRRSGPIARRSSVTIP